MRVRPARRADIPGLRRLGTATWQVAYQFAGPEYIAHGLRTWWTRRALLDCLRQTTTLVVDHDEQVVAVGNIDLRGAVPVIWKLYVHPDAQGVGAGSALLAALLDAAPPDAEQVQLEYVQGNQPAADFYTAKGFQLLRREPAERPGWPGTVWVGLRLAPRRSATGSDCERAETIPAGDRHKIPPQPR